MNIADVIHAKADGPQGQIFTIGPGDNVTTLLAALAEHNVGALVVTEGSADDLQVVGIVSERDIVRRLARDGAEILDRPVSEIMTTSVLTCTPADAVDAIAETMTDRRIRHMPVLADGKLAGLVSIGDVVRSRIRQLEHDRGQLEQYISS
jgi:CBS domain-containing protein